MNGSILQHIRQTLELTEQQLANILRVSTLQVFRWEHNLQPIPVVTERTIRRFHAHGLGSFRPF